VPKTKLRCIQTMLGPCLGCCSVPQLIRTPDWNIAFLTRSRRLLVDMSRRYTLYFSCIFEQTFSCESAGWVSLVRHVCYDAPIANQFTLTRQKTVLMSRSVEIRLEDRPALGADVNLTRMVSPRILVIDSVSKAMSPQSDQRLLDAMNRVHPAVLP
jgi:hypothetical protein